MNNIQPAIDLKNYVSMLQEVADSPRNSATQKKYLCVTKQGFIEVKIGQKGKLSLKAIKEIAEAQLKYASQLSEEALSEKEFSEYAKNISKVLLQLNAERAAKRDRYAIVRTILAVALAILSIPLIGIPFIFFYKNYKTHQSNQKKIDRFAKQLIAEKKEKRQIANKHFERDPKKEIFSQLKSLNLHRQPESLKYQDKSFTVAYAVFVDTLREPSILVKIPNQIEISYHSHEDVKGVTRYFSQLLEGLKKIQPQAIDSIFTNLITLHSGVALAEECEAIYSAFGKKYALVANFNNQKDSQVITSSIIIKVGAKEVQSRIHTLFKINHLRNFIPTGECAYMVNTLDRTLPWSVLSIPHRKIMASDLRFANCSSKYSPIFATQEEAFDCMKQATLHSSQ